MNTNSLLGNKCKICGYEIPVEDREPENHRVLVIFAHIKDVHYKEMNWLERKMLDMVLKQNGLDMDAINAYLDKFSKEEQGVGESSV